MKKISNTKYAEIERELASLNEAISEFNSKREDLADFLTDLGNKRDDLKQKVEDLAQEMDDFYDEKSDKWKEGDAGSQYDTWKSNWSEFKDRLEEIDADSVDRDIDDVDDLPPADSSEA